MSLDDALGAPLSRHRPFVNYWLARIAATIALQMQSVAIAWQMYQITNSPLDLGLVGLFQFMPAIVLVLIAGHIADRYDRRKIVRICHFMIGACGAVLAAGTAGGWLTREALLGIVLIVGAARTFEATTFQTLLPSVVPLPLLARATAASSSATQLAVIGGPALGGLLYAVSPVLVYSLCCALYIAAGLLVGMITINRTPARREPISWPMLFAGFSYVRDNRLILGAIALDLFAVVLGGATALLPVFARDVFHVGPWGLGLLRAAPGAGALLLALVMTRWPPRRRVGRIVFGAVTMFGLSIIVFSLSTSFPLSLAALAVLGASDMVSVVIRQTIIQLQTPDEMRGRVSAVNSLFVQASNQLGEFRAGLMAAWIGTIPAVLVGGIGALLVVAVGRKAFSELYFAETLDAPRR